MAVTKDSSDLEDIKGRFDYDTDEWAEIRKQGREDIRSLSPTGPWSDTDIRLRESQGRPCLHMDELSQFVNQLINDVRAQKRGIEVNPEGTEDNDAKARLRANLIRQIEYRSNAQQAYTSMFEDAVQRSYGFLRVNTRYVQQRVDNPNEQSFEQEIRIDSIHNPDVVTPDANALRPDLSDMQHCMVRDPFTHKQFKRKWPKAEIQDFTADVIQEAGPRWMDSQRVWVGEFWAIETKPKTLLMLPGPDPLNPHQGAVAIWKHTIPDNEWDSVKGLILREREVEQPYVCQKLTNGLEILEKNDWPGNYIPIVGCLGKVLWVEEGSGARRQIHSLIRLARDPQMLYDYYCTSEAEIVGMTPKFPYFAYEGQLSKAQEELLSKSLHEPVATIKVRATVEGLGNQVLPHPQRQPWDPPIQAFSIGREEQRRAIQSATGSGFLPSQAQRKNEKSGVALKQIETSAQKGSYHFIDHYEDALRHTGVIINDLIPHIYDTARDIYVRKPDDTPIHVRINDPSAPPNEEYGGVSELDSTSGEFDVTISSGPNYESEREKASEFADLLAQNPQVFPLIAPMVVKLKNLGPIGDQMAEDLEVLQPPELRKKKDGQQPDPAAMQQQLMQAQQMMQQAQAQIAEMQKVIETKQIEQQGQSEINQAKIAADERIKLAEYERDLELARIKFDYELRLLARKTVQENTNREDEQKHDMAIHAAEADLKIEQSERAAEQARESAMMAQATNDDEDDGA